LPKAPKGRGGTGGLRKRIQEKKQYPKKGVINGGGGNKKGGLKRGKKPRGETWKKKKGLSRGPGVK